MNTPGKDYTHHSWLAAAALIAVLVAVSFIPPQSVGGVKLRRANILSDLLSFDDAEAAEPAAECHSAGTTPKRSSKRDVTACVSAISGRSTSTCASGSRRKASAIASK